MSSQDTDREAQRHLAMALLGAAAGFAMWVLVDVLPDTLDNARLLLWIASATIGFFVVLFALLGGLRWQLALAGAAVLSLTDAALLYWSSGRFLELGTALEDSALPYAWAMVLFIGAPFATALLKGRPTEYALLFETAWTIVVRYVAAWIFVGVFWGLLFLSDELLEIVGLTIIGDLVDEEPVPYLLTGTA